jgi:hypothetical protein
MHIRVTNGQPEKYTIGQLRRDNPNVSFPKQIPDTILAGYNVFPVTPVERPATDHTKNVAEGPLTLVDGVWTQSWVITDASAEELAIRREEKARSVRSERDHLLQQSDWVVTAHAERGLPVPPEWRSYRQALRDISKQAGWPYSVTWPVGG